MSVPTLTPEQREQNLAKAVETRRARAAALARVSDGTLSIADALAEPVLQRAKVRQFLLKVKGIGPAKAATLMSDLQIHEDRRVAGLGPNQREALVARMTAA
jgi:predicted flap endonuclease-1-like 5' DNA nuclease